MFTGIIETIGTVDKVDQQEKNLILSVSSSLGSSLKVDQSLSHNGVCLTVTSTDQNTHQVIAVEETLHKSNLKHIKIGDKLNLERALTLESRLDGHLVQGHVDTVGRCIERVENEGSTIFSFDFPVEFSALVIEKGAIALNGISLTVFDVTHTQFSVAVIPYTLEHTILKFLKKDDEVNLEFDLIGKYTLRMKEVGV